MSKGPGKINTSAGLSEEELAELTSELAAPAPPQPTELDALKAQITLLLKQNDELSKRTTEKEDSKSAEATVSKASTKARYAITIEEGHEQHDSPDVFVGVNGRSYQIKRGERVEVPPEVLEVLDHAVIDKHIPVSDNNGMPNGTQTRASRRFPYQNHGLVVNAAGDRVVK